MLRHEVETSEFGNQIVVRNLLSSLFVYVMRAWADAASPTTKDWFSALRSTHTARALARIHEAPEHAWTLENLAKEAGLSRAAFARNFSASVGEPPHSYLTRWRMGIAAQLLEETDLRLGEIASRVGYRSEFSFSRAFKLARGASPIQYRRATPARSAIRITGAPLPAALGLAAERRPRHGPSSIAGGSQLDLRQSTRFTVPCPGVLTSPMSFESVEGCGAKRVGRTGRPWRLKRLHS
jgi:AraC-like DNA-binding protein